jgi:hypothetical protein
MNLITCPSQNVNAKCDCCLNRKARRPKKADTWREQSDEDESGGEATSDSDDQGVGSKGRGSGHLSSREERRARRSRGSDDKKETDDDADEKSGADSEQEAADESDKEDTTKTSVQASLRIFHTQNMVLSLFQTPGQRPTRTRKSK